MSASLRSHYHALHRFGFLFTFIILVGLALSATCAGSVGAAADASTGRLQSDAQVELRGWLNVLIGDPPPGSGEPPIVRYMLTDGYGLVAQLTLDPQTAYDFKGQFVVVTGRRAPAALGAGVEVIEVTSIAPAETRLLAAPGPQGLSGTLPWITLLCRYADDATVPHPPSWYGPLLGSAYPGMDHYWREISYNQINLSGSAVRGWYTLPQPKSYYTMPTGTIDWGRTLNDCATAADADVFFPTYYGINLFFSSTIQGRAWGSSAWGLTRDGQDKAYAVTWIPSVWANHYGLAHEMGHGFGLPHSAGPTGLTYMSEWDVVSMSGCRVSDPNYGCIAGGTISVNLDHFLHWIPSARKFVASNRTESIITLERLNQPPGANYLMAQIPIGDSTTRFYTLEARQFSGYDRNLPGEGVVIHHVDLDRRDASGNPQDPAWVVDGDGDGDGNDDGAWWVPGEIFNDPLNKIQVEVLSASGATYTVRIVNNATTEQTLRFTPSHDARVNADAPNSVYGTSSPLRVRGTSAPLYNSYLKFDVTGLSGSVQRATLRLFAYDGSANGGSLYAVSNNYRNTSMPWLETGITWNNAPTIGGTPLSSITTTVANNTWLEYDVTAAITGNGTYSFGLTSLSSNTLLMNSKEASANRPELVIVTRSTVVIPPENDSFSRSVDISPLPFSDSRETAGATSETGEPMPSCGSGSSTVWYRFHAGMDRTVSFGTFGAYDTWLAVYTGNSLSNLVEIVCNDDFGGSGSRVQLAVTEGQLYYAQVGRKPGATGDPLFFDVSVPGPQNENYDSAALITGLPYEDTQDVLSAWDHDDDPAFSCWPTGPYHSVWYRYTPAANGKVHFNTYGSNYNTALVVLTGSPDNFTEIACNDDYSGSQQSQVDVQLTAGTTYYVMVVGELYGYDRSRLVFHASASGDTPTETVTFAPIHDARVNGDSPNSVYGTSSPLRVRGASAPLYNSYLKFDVTGVTGNVQRATLRLFAYDGSANGGSLYAVSNNYRNTTTPWLETGITWNNAPTLSGTPVSTITTTVPNNTWIEYDVTAAVTGYGTYSFGLTSNSSNTLLMNSKEASANRPELVVTFGTDTTPPPNDNSRYAIEITGFPFTDTQSTTYALEVDMEDDYPSDCMTSNGGGGTVWYRFRATANELIRFDTIGSNYDTWLTVFSGDDHADFGGVGCNDDFNGNPYSQLALLVEAGTLYHIQIGGLAPRGTLVFNAVSFGTQPPNDDFDSATNIVMTNGVYQITQNTGLATSADDDPRAGCRDVGANVWFRYTPTTSHMLELSTEGSNYTTWLAVFTGTRGNFAEMACNDFAEGEVFSRIRMLVEAGVTYHILIGGDDGDSGDLVLTARDLSPANDDFDSATSIVMTNGVYQVTQETGYATDAPDDPRASCWDVGANVWFRYTPTTSHMLQLSAQGSNYDTWMAVFTGTRGNLTEVACNDFIEPQMYSYLNFPVTQGVTYSVMIGGDDGDAGTLQLTARIAPPPPPNDDSRFAIDITSFPFTDTRDTTSATDFDLEDDHPSPCYDINGATVWYRFRASASETIRFDTIGSSYDTWLTVFSGEDHADFIDEACNDDYNGNPYSRLDFQTQAGTLYHIQIGGLAPRGTLVFNAARVGVQPPATVTFTPLHDARVNGDSPNSVYGTSNPLRLRGTSAPLYNSYLKFDVTGLSGPVQRATLRLFATDGSANGGSAYTVSNNYRNTTTPWLETGITWNNAPAIGGTPLSSVTATVADNTWLEYDVTAAITGNGVYSFGLTSASSNSLLMNSKEASSNRPELVIQMSGAGAAIIPLAPPTAEATEMLLAPPAEPVIVMPNAALTPEVAATVEAEGDGVVRTAGWVAMERPQGASGGVYVINTAPQDALALPFSGTRVDIAYVAGPAFGSFTLLVDGQAMQTVNSQQAEFSFGNRIALDGLADGPHELRIVPEAGQVAAIDAFSLPLTAPTIAITAESSMAEPATVEITDAAPPPVTEPALTEVAAPPSATPTETPVLLPPAALPVFAGMDDGAPDWTATGGWALSADAAYGGIGLGWQAQAGVSGIDVLAWLRPIDLRAAQQPLLTLQSRMAGAGSSGALQVQGASGNWDTVAVFLPAADWQPVVVDLRGYAGQVIALRFVWLGALPADGAAPDRWQIDVLGVQEAPVATPPPVIVTPPLSEPAAEVTAPVAATAAPPEVTIAPTETAMPTVPPEQTVESAAPATEAPLVAEPPQQADESPASISAAESTAEAAN